MWSFQYSFRPGVEFGVTHALELIGAPMEARVLLVGYRIDDARPHAVCVEPETGPLTQAHLDDVPRRTDEIYAADPESQIHHSHPDVHRSRQEWNYRRARANATVEAVEASGAHDGLRFFASTSTPIGGYEVHTLIGLDQQRIDALPAFDSDIHHRIHVGRSLAHEVIYECLRRADQALYLPDPGAGLEDLGAPSTVIVRAAAETLIDGCAFRSGNQPSELAHGLDDITAAAYERQGAHGRMILVHTDHPEIRARVQLPRPVRLRDTRASRKLLEITDDDLALLVSGRDAFAFGDVASFDIGAYDECFEVVIPSAATWELRHRGTPLMRVAYGQPSLPRPLLDRAAFEDSVSRRIGDADTATLWAYVDAASASGHGTTLVISSDATGETKRLAGQATIVEPTKVSIEDLARLARIDGALLFDETGVCHAIGVILDGLADGAGNPARGSRYNSAVRYEASAAPNTVVIVVSEDGTVDLLPRLAPRVARRAVQAAVDGFRAAATSDPVEGERFARAFEVVEQFAFYLSDGECNEINMLYEAEQDRRFATGGMAIRRIPLTPDPLMNDGYFLPGS
jgi:hypothetical protein